MMVNLIIIGFIAPLSIYSMQRYLQSERRSELLAFALLTSGIVLWELNSIVAKAMVTMGGKMFWLKIGNAVTVPILLYGFLWFAVTYSRSESIDLRWILGVAIVHVLVISPLFFLRPDLWFEAAEMASYGPVTILGITFQEWLVRDLTHLLPFKLYQVYIYAVTTLGAAVLLRYLYRKGGEISRMQTVFVAIGVFSPLFGNALVFFEAVPSAINTTDLAFGVTGIAFGVAMFRYRLFDLVPMGREQLVESMSDPVIMLDEERRVVDSNAAARELSTISEDWRGTPATEFLGPFSDLLDRLKGEDPVDAELEITIDGTDRIFDINVSPIESSTRQSGQLIILRDVTELKVRERQLETQRNTLTILNKIVRHDIRNDLQLVIAYADTLEDYVGQEGKTYLSQLQNAADDAVDITKSARDVTDVMLKTGVGTEPVDLQTTFETEIKEAKARSETAQIIVSGSIDTIQVQADELLESLFRNLLTNAIKHNDSDVPKVEVSTTRNNGRIQIAIADNGPGIPPDQRESIFQEGETNLNSEGSGLGLYLVQTLVDRYNGNIWIEENDPRGTVFVVELNVVE